ncbi:MAG: aldose 1-epimerase [Acidobacteriota bacterium]|jgi:galactose mutarotase-like enzyme|nr:aldose 1-epimerase [Acidobacteriota bacterium]
MPVDETVEIGGARAVTLQRPASPDTEKPAFLSAQILPGRGMMTLQVRARIPSQGDVDLLFAPPLDEARELLDRGEDGFPGNGSYLIGGGILLPYANRIRGELSPDGKTVLAEILGKPVRLPANAGGRKPGAERFSMHGLILAARAEEVRRETTPERDILRASLQAGNFGGCWVSAAEIEIENVLTDESFTLTVTARNVGGEPLPMGIGWHPYFALPSGRREQARLHIPARGRALVNNYDEVLPTGEVEPVAGTLYDFSMPGGRAIGNLYLDDCFVDLDRSAAGEIAAEIVDPAASYGLRVVAASPPVSAIQVYAPPDKGFIVLEPQFNLADPFGRQWGPRVDTGMAILEPGESSAYSARLELFTP